MINLIILFISIYSFNLSTNESSENIQNNATKPACLFSFDESSNSRLISMILDNLLEDEYDNGLCILIYLLEHRINNLSEQQLEIVNNLVTIFSTEAHYYTGNYQAALQAYKLILDNKDSTKLQIANACIKLGNMYFAGLGVEQDYNVARQYYKDTINIDWQTNNPELLGIEYNARNLAQDKIDEIDQNKVI